MAPVTNGPWWLHVPKLFNMFSDHLESCQTLQKVSDHPNIFQIIRKFPNHMESFQTIWKVSTPSRNLWILACLLMVDLVATSKNSLDSQKLSGWQCRHETWVFLTLNEWVKYCVRWFCVVSFTNPLETEECRMYVEYCSNTCCYESLNEAE